MASETAGGTRKQTKLLGAVIVASEFFCIIRVRGPNGGATDTLMVSPNDAGFREGDFVDLIVRTSSEVDRW